MNKRYRRRLVVGKFCPLHRGHEFLIQRAQAECDDVLVISYTKPGFDCARREHWIRMLFPELQVLCLDDARLATACAKLGLAQRALPFDTDQDRTHREFVAWLCTHILQVRVEAVFTSEDYGDGFAQVLSDCFSAFDGRKHTVAHVCVDKSRQHIPISGTALRDDIFQHRSWLSPVVYESFVRRVCLLGGESTGKTTLAEALSRQFDTTWVPEYGRELWDARLGHLAYEDMAHIAQTQIARESRQKQHAWYLNELRSRDIEFVLLQGSMPQRINMMTSLLNGWESKGKV